MNHILIPTDFTVTSLQPVHTAMKYYYKGGPIKITLLHLLHMPNGIQDLLTRPANVLPKEVVSAEFTAACEILNSKYASRLQQLDVLVKYGNTAAYANNLLQGIGVNAVWINDPFVFTPPCTLSVNFSPLLKKLQVPVKKAPTVFSAAAGNSLSELLVSDALEINYNMAYNG